jgi:hypothetical protein
MSREKLKFGAKIAKKSPFMQKSHPLEDGVKLRISFFREAMLIY